MNSHAHTLFTFVDFKGFFLFKLKKIYYERAKRKRTEKQQKIMTEEDNGNDDNEDVRRPLISMSDDFLTFFCVGTF